MKKIITITIICIACFITVGCGKTMSLELSGNTVVVDYTEDGVRQLINDKEDVKSLQNSFSTEYKEIISFDEGKADIIFHFGNDIDLNMNNNDEIVSVFIINDYAYINDGESNYKSTSKVKFPIINEKYRHPNPNKKTKEEIEKEIDQ